MQKLIYQTDGSDMLLQSLFDNGEMLSSLIETDGGVKKASSDVISRDIIEQFRPKSASAFLVHLIAMGDSDYYGANKNSDWFGTDQMDKRAHTFVDYGHVFREHRNRNYEVNGIGTIKYAARNKNVRRTELIIEMDRDKAPEEYELAKEAKELNFSMSCRIPYDVCSCCGNKSANFAGYCDCLRYSRGQYMPAFQKYAYMINVDPTFFDISRVVNPADRIARHLEYMFHDSTEKAAASCLGVPSVIAAEAEGVELPEEPLSISEQLVLGELADAEQYTKAAAATNIYADARAYRCLQVYPAAGLEKFSSEELAGALQLRPEVLMRELAKSACILPLQAWAQYVFQDAAAADAPIVKEAAILIPGVFTRMRGGAAPAHSVPPVSAWGMGDAISECFDPHKDDFVQKFMDRVEEKFSVKPEQIGRRVLRITVSVGAPECESIAKSSSETEYGDALAHAYGNYALKAVCNIRDINGVDSEMGNVYDIVAGANAGCPIMRKSC